MKSYQIYWLITLIRRITFLIVFSVLYNGYAATLNVPSQYGTIQQAIDAASNYDTIVLDVGVYSEFLSIDKALVIIGAGMGQSIIRYDTVNIAIITVDGSSLSNTDKIEFIGLTINGGSYIPPDIFFGVSAKAIESDDANLCLDSISINLISNYGITVEDGSLYAKDVQIFPDYLSYTFQCDIGINIKNSFAVIEDLSQTRGNVDHTIDVNAYIMPPDPLFSDVVVLNCTIRSSVLSWGECVRTYGNSHVLIDNCNFYRPSGGAAAGVAGHSGLGINGPYANVWVRNTTFDGIPWGTQIHGSLVNSNRIVFAGCTIKNSDEGGIQVKNASYKILDLGGGNFGSPGGNQFSNNNGHDVLLELSTEDVFAGYNSWSNNANPDMEIHDKLDDPALGKVIHDLTCQSAFSAANGNRISEKIFGNGVFETDGIIESVQEIIDSADVEYNSAISITLLPEFLVELGAVFEIDFSGCSH